MTLVRALLFVLVAVGPVLAAGPASPRAPWLLDQVKTLAAPEMEVTSVRIRAVTVTPRPGPPRPGR